MTRGAIRAQAFDHFQNARAVRGQADVVADIERGAGKQMFARQIGQLQAIFSVHRQQAERTQRGQQDHRGSFGEAQPFAQFGGCHRLLCDAAEEIEMSDGRGQELGGVAAANEFEDRRRIDARRQHGGKGHAIFSRR